MSLASKRLFVASSSVSRLGRTHRLPLPQETFYASQRRSLVVALNVTKRGLRELPSSPSQAKCQVDAGNLRKPISTQTEELSRSSAEPEFGNDSLRSKPPVTIQDHKGHALRDRSPDQRMAQSESDWYMALEHIRHCRRHSGMDGAKAACKKILDQDSYLPTEGTVAVELWDHLIQVGATDSKFLFEVASYLVNLQQHTGRTRHGFYSSVVGTGLGISADDAYLLHVFLKGRFPPSRDDYEELFRASLLSGRHKDAAFERIYEDHPVLEMYSTIVPTLCEQEMRAEATRWHFLLLKKGDLPPNLLACKPLLELYAHIKDSKQIDILVKSLLQSQVWFETAMDREIRNEAFLSREILSRMMGRAHGIAPKEFTDEFCARLFATKFFPVDMVISGLLAIGTKSIGSSSLREIVIRDEYSCSKVCSHLAKLHGAAILVKDSRYNNMIRRAAISGDAEGVRSIVDSDLHPDTFEDSHLQERLLTSYCDKGDKAQMESTLAILEFGAPKTTLMRLRANIMLRCHISLKDQDRVISSLGTMQRKKIPLSPKSSKHLRVLYLSKRRAGARPLDTEQEIRNLDLVINAMKMTLETGNSLPLESWRELLRRLGMMGLLSRYENLALWLMDRYANPSCPIPIPNSRSSEAGFRRLSGTTPRATAIGRLALATTQNRELLSLFGKQAQQGMIAWGFQADVKRRPNLHHSLRGRLMKCPPKWSWGIKLLKELQRRGLPVHKANVAKICKMQLGQLFDENHVSARKVNRRSKSLNNLRANLMAKYQYSAYVREMEEIWGRDLFDDGGGGGNTVGTSIHGPLEQRWRII